MYEAFIYTQWLYIAAAGRKAIYQVTVEGNRAALLIMCRVHP